MSKNTGAAEVGRRGFLKGATIAGAAVLAPLDAMAQNQAPTAAAPAPVQAPPRPKSLSGVSAATKFAESGVPAAADNLVEATAGSDFMVDCFKSVGFEYLPAMPGSSFRALQESIVNYGKNSAPEFLTCTHEEASVAMSHGYFKIEGKPLLNFVHGTVGLQHATMAIYNAYCDRVPVVIVGGNDMDATMRRPGVEWTHTVQDAAVIVRDYTKWDDYPGSLQHWAESTVRAYKVAMTPPMGPVVLMADGTMAEDPIPDATKLSIPKLSEISIAVGDPNAVLETARALVAAESPVIMCDRGSRPGYSLPHLVELAELLQCAVVDAGSRMNFPTQHPLNQSGRRRAVVTQADVIVGIDMFDFWGEVHSYRDQLHRTSAPILKPGTKTITITAGDQFIKANYQDFERYPGVDIAIGADGGATLPLLVEAVKKLITADNKAAYAARGKKLAAARAAAFKASLNAATWGWDDSPISTARLCAELWNQIKDEDWSLVSEDAAASSWPHRLWKMDKHYHFIGAAGGYGVGYGAPAAVGAALANRKYGRLSVAIQKDGDLMVSPGALWTAAKHKIPILMVMHNNRCYHQEIMHLQRMANRRLRDPTTAHVGTEISHPNIDYGKLAQSLGVHGEGPITDPKDIGPALKRAIGTVKSGEPALVDIVTQGR